MKNNKISKVVAMVIAGLLNATEVQVVELVKTGNKFLRFFYRAKTITLVELAYLYFNLSKERQPELQEHLNNIGSDFVAWKRFFHEHGQHSESIAQMAYEEMLNKSSRHYQLLILSGLPISDALKNKIAKKMFFLAGNNFTQLVDAHRLAKPGSLLRRKILVVIKTVPIERNELRRAYQLEATWTHLRRFLIEKIADTEWSPKESFLIIPQCYRDSKLRSLIIMGLNFSQLNTAFFIANDVATKRAILLAMLRLADSVEQENIVKEIALNYKLNKISELIASRCSKRSELSSRPVVMSVSPGLLEAPALSVAV